MEIKVNIINTKTGNIKYYLFLYIKHLDFYTYAY